MPLTILVVDDDLGTRLAISDYLVEVCGYSVATAVDGREALDMVETYHPHHLMVTDVVMPRMNGYELVRRVRQHPGFRLLPVIFLSGRNKTEERIQGYQTGADLYLPHLSWRNWGQRFAISWSDHRSYSLSTACPTKRVYKLCTLQKLALKTLKTLSLRSV